MESMSEYGKELKKIIYNYKKEKKDDISKRIYIKSNFGKKFVEKYEDLEEFIVYGTLLPAVFKSYNSYIEFLFSGKLFNYIRNEKKLSEEEMQDLEQFEEILEKVNTLIETPEKEENAEKKEQEEEGFEDVINKLKPISRMIDYFILTLYAYFDVYSMSLFQETISKIQIEKIYGVMESIRQFRNPKETIQKLLQCLITNKGIKLSNVLEKVLKEADWGNTYNVLDTFKELRDKIAHRKPLTSPTILKEEFKIEKQIAERKYKKAYKNFQKQKIPEELKELFYSVLKELEIFILVGELGRSVFRYVFCVDNLVYSYFLNKEK